MRLRFTRLSCIVVALIGSFASGCASPGPARRIDFSREIDKVRPGMSDDEVRSRLGDPDRRHEGVVALHPDPLPAVNLAAMAAVGTPYREWYYRRSDSRYHVFFVPGPTRGGWQVLTVRANPAGAE